MGGAVVFWLLNALNKVYTTEIDYPVSWILDESNVVLDKVPPSTLRLEVTGSGWKLLRCLLRIDVQPVELPVAKVSKKGQIRIERLYPFFTKRLKELKVHRVSMEETIYVHTISSNLPKK